VRQPIYATYAEFRNALQQIVDISDPVQREAQLSAFWTRLNAAGQIPFAVDDRVAFLYRGSASLVAWRGDFNGWGISNGQRLGDTNVWIHERTLPSAARADYKVFLNQSQWILDPGNPLQIWSGFGPNSELRMPAYQFPRETVAQTGIAHGSLGSNQRISSQRLGYDVQYRVYTPAGYNQLDDLPVVYVTDGHEYAADYLGSLSIVLDNLIADQTIRPAVAVFIDPRDPDNLSNNRRAQQYVANRQFADFVTQELVPRIDQEFDTSTSRDDRTILGTSLGGLNSAYFGVVADGTFANLGIQSPAFQVYTQIYDLYRNGPLRDLNISMTGGTLGDNASSRAMETILHNAGYTFEYLEVDEGHSWGAWRGQLDRFLIATVGPVPEPAFGIWAGMIWLALRRWRFEPIRKPQSAIAKCQS
jgi:enterochelin esterase family protein